MVDNYCACSGNDPVYHIKLNQQGPPGKAGAQGPQGIQGIQGIRGPKGYSPTITVKTSTNKEYILTINNETESYDTPNLIGDVSQVFLPYTTNVGDTISFNKNIIGSGKAGFSFNVFSDITDNISAKVDYEFPLTTYYVENGKIISTVTDYFLSTNTTLAGDNIVIAREGSGVKISAIVPTKLSELNNDTNFVNQTQLAEGLEPKANKIDLSTVATTGNYNDLNNLPTIPTLPENITTQGNTFNNANQLVQLDNEGKLPAIDGSNLTGIATQYELPIASNTTLGGVKIGENLTITEDGTLNATLSDTSNFATREEVNTVQTEVTTLKNRTYTDGLFLDAKNNNVFVNHDETLGLEPYQETALDTVFENSNTRYYLQSFLADNPEGIDLNKNFRLTCKKISHNSTGSSFDFGDQDTTVTPTKKYSNGFFVTENCDDHILSIQNMAYDNRVCLSIYLPEYTTSKQELFLQVDWSALNKEYTFNVKVGVDGTPHTGTWKPTYLPNPCYLGLSPNYKSYDIYPYGWRNVSLYYTSSETVNRLSAKTATTDTLGIVKPDNTTITIDSNGVISSVGGGTTVAESSEGIQGYYSTHYGILDCPNGLIDYNATGTEVTFKAGIVMQLPGQTTKTTNGSDVTKTLTSTGKITLFYCAGELLEVSNVSYQETEPADITTDNYQAYFKPSTKTWYLKSNDTGNVFREAACTPVANITITDGNITRVDYIGYRILDDDLMAQKTDVEALRLTIQELTNRIIALETVIDGGNA